MSTSTHAGFSGGSATVRPALPSPRAASVRVVPACASLPSVERDPLDFESVAVGVGHAAASPSCPRRWPGRETPLWSVAAGVGQRVTSPSDGPYSLGSRTPALSSLARGVGHRNDEHPLSSMGGAHIGSSDPRPLDVVPEVDEVADNVAQAPPKESAHVLDDDHPRPELADEPRVLAPESGAGSVESGPEPGVGHVLAGEAAAEHVDRSERCASDESDIGVPLRGGPVPREHGTAVRIALDLPRDGPEPGPLEAELEPADPAEQGPDHWPASRSAATISGNCTSGRVGWSTRR